VSAMRLSGKTALITGAAGGIGAEIARRFREEGASVFVADVNRVEGEKTAASMGAVFIPLDITSEESWKAALSAVLERTGRLDVLVNNAGINIRKNIEEMPVESFDAMFAVNVRGPFLGIKHSLPIMRAAGGGVILNMSSICGLVGHKYTNETYTATKGALTLLTKSVAVRYAKDNIRCNSVHPARWKPPSCRPCSGTPSAGQSDSAKCPSEGSPAPPTSRTPWSTSPATKPRSSTAPRFL